MASILLVDDEESPRATLALLLKQAGHDVVQAEGVVAAAEALAAAAFDLVITDLRASIHHHHHIRCARWASA